MYYYTCKAVLTHVLHKFYWAGLIQPGINANAQILPDSTDLTRHQCKWISTQFNYMYMYCKC